MRHYNNSWLFARRDYAKHKHLTITFCVNHRSSLENIYWSDRHCFTARPKQTATVDLQQHGYFGCFTIHCQCETWL